MARILPEPTRESLNLTQVLGALADPARQHLLRQAYQERQPLACSDAAERLDLSPATLSHHWKVLREAGLTRTTVLGRTRSIEVRTKDLEHKFPGLLDSILAANETDLVSDSTTPRE